MAGVRLGFSQSKLDEILDNEEKFIFCEKFSDSSTYWQFYQQWGDLDCSD